MVDVTDFTGYYDDQNVVWADEEEVELTRDNLPESPQVWVLKATTAG